MYNDIQPRKYKFFQLTTYEMKNNQLLVGRAHASPLMQEVRVELGDAIKPWKADVTRRCMIMMGASAISQADKQCDGYALMGGGSCDSRSSRRRPGYRMQLDIRVCVVMNMTDGEDRITRCKDFKLP